MHDRADFGVYKVATVQAEMCICLWNSWAMCMHARAGGASQSPSLSDTDLKEFPKAEACVAWGSSGIIAVAAAAAATGDSAPPAHQPSCELCSVEAGSAEVLKHQKGAAEAQQAQDAAHAAEDRCDHAECGMLPPAHLSLLVLAAFRHHVLTSTLLPLSRSGHKHQQDGEQAAHLSTAQEPDSRVVSTVTSEDDVCCAAAAAPAAEAQPAPATADDAQQSPAAAEESAVLPCEEVVEGEQRESEGVREEEAAGEQQEGAAAESIGLELQGEELHVVLSLDVDAEEVGSQGSGPMVTVQRGKPASITADEEVRWTLPCCETCRSQAPRKAYSMPTPL
jgi:hypothetical protein